MNEQKKGNICALCYEKLKVVAIDCRGTAQRGEPAPTILACRCLHPGDYLCNCGKPCYSFF